MQASSDFGDLTAKPYRQVTTNRPDHASPTTSSSNSQRASIAGCLKRRLDVVCRLDGRGDSVRYRPISPNSAVCDFPRLGRPTSGAMWGTGGTEHDAGRRVKVVPHGGQGAAIRVAQRLREPSGEAAGCAKNMRVCRRVRPPTETTASTLGRATGTVVSCRGSESRWFRVRVPRGPPSDLAIP